jgi:hypothetical protein
LARRSAGVRTRRRFTGRSSAPAVTPSESTAHDQSPGLRGFRFPAEVILWVVRWYLQFGISCRDLEAMLADRGVAVDHTTMYRWVQRFAPEIEKRTRRPHHALEHSSRSLARIIHEGRQCTLEGTCRL